MENLLTHLAVEDHVAGAVGVEFLIGPEVRHRLAVTYKRTGLEGQASHAVVGTPALVTVQLARPLDRTGYQRVGDEVELAVPILVRHGRHQDQTVIDANRGCVRGQANAQGLRPCQLGLRQRSERRRCGDKEKSKENEAWRQNARDHANR